MTDERYVYQQYIRDKKTTSRGARAKRNGSKSKKCSLPSDGMTQAQWKRRNSEVKTYNIKFKMTYEQFKDMPQDLQGKYLTQIVQAYGATLADIARDVFGVNPNTLWMFCKSRNISTPRTSRDSLSQPDWSEFLGGLRDAFGNSLWLPAEEAIDEGGTDTLPPPKSPEKRTIYPSDGELVFDCTPAEMVDYIMRSLNSDETYTWRVFFARREEDAHV